jgi:hypothetical protein
MTDPRRSGARHAGPRRSGPRRSGPRRSGPRRSGARGSGARHKDSLSPDGRVRVERQLIPTKKVWLTATLGHAREHRVPQVICGGPRCGGSLLIRVHDAWL